MQSEDVASAIASAIAAGSGNTVTIPAGTCTWTSNVTSPASGTLPNIAIIGATTCTGSGSVASPIACTDNTIINSNGGLWYLEIGAGTTVRLSGISFESAAVTNGIVQVQGPTSGTVPQVRIDHVHGLLSSDADTAFAISAVTGVIDHSLFDEQVSSEGNAIRFYYPLAGDSGDQSWANVTGLGGAGYMYVENNTFNHGVANDGEEGARFAFASIHSMILPCRRTRQAVMDVVAAQGLGKYTTTPLLPLRDARLSAGTPSL